MKSETDKYYHMIRTYVKSNLDRIFKDPDSCLKYPFLDPGSVYNGNLWDWDTFWTSYALIHLEQTETTKDETYTNRLIEHMQGNIHNFIYHQMEDGYIPMMIKESELEEPYFILKRKQKCLLNMHKPFLCQQICIISGFIDDYSWVAGYVSNLEKYFKRYKEDYFNENCGLYVWADDVMIGVDNDPASFGRPRFSTANIFLNSFMVRELNAMAKILSKTGEIDKAAIYTGHANELINAVHAESWDKRDKFFYSVDCDIKTRSYDWFHKGLGVFWKSIPIRIQVWSGFLPMLCGFASEEQALELLRHAQNSDSFCAPFGIRTLSREEKMYNLEETNNPSNWLGSIWIIANYAVFRGFLKYGYYEEAKSICEKTLCLLGTDLEKNKTLHEYYIPETGEPVTNPNFMNWNMLAVNMYDELNGFKSVDDYLL